MYKPNQDILLAETQVKFTIDGRLVSAPAKVIQRLWPSPRVSIKVSSVERHPQPIAQDAYSKAFPIISEGPEFLQLENGTTISVLPSSWGVNQKEVTLHLRQSPTNALDLGKPKVSLRFDIVNITSDVFDWPLALKAPPWLVTLDPVPHLTELEKGLRTDGGYAVTHYGTIRRIDGQAFSEEELNFFLGGLKCFLSFVCGSHCGISNPVGFDVNGNETWKQWGASHVSPYKRRRSWADPTIIDTLSKLYGGFWKEYVKSNKHLNRIFGWYVYSNEAELIDLSIVLNQVILELLLARLMPGSNGKKGKRIAKMLQGQCIDTQIPAHFEELRSLAKDKQFEHGPHTLVEIRNSMVHAEQGLDTHYRNALYEAKQLGLWYVELLILRMFGYTGEYASRLTSFQLLGATEAVPWNEAGDSL